MHRSLFLTILAAVLPFSLAAPPSLNRPLPASRPPLEVNQAPQSPRPYVIRHFASAQAVQIGNDLFRFPVTGNSSGGAFSLVNTNTPSSPVLNIFPHYHKIHYETFFNYKGRIQLWHQHEADQQARILTAGDFGALPPGTNHTFQTIDPDTELLTCIVPGGLEAVFFAIGKLLPSTTNTPYPPIGKPFIPTISNVSDLYQYDVYAEPSFSPRRDLVNGTAPQNTVWHTGPNTPASGSVDPYFIANGFGPKYLTKPTSYAPTPFYQIVQPLVPVATSGKNFSISTISINRASHSKHSSLITASGGACAFEVLEGALSIKIASYPPTVLYTGDVAFIPQGIKYSYSSVTSFTKVYYVSAGNNGIDQILMGKGQPWNDVVFPLN